VLASLPHRQRRDEPCEHSLVQADDRTDPAQTAPARAAGIRQVFSPIAVPSATPTPAGRHRACARTLSPSRRSASSGAKPPRELGQHQDNHAHDDCLLHASHRAQTGSAHFRRRSPGQTHSVRSAPTEAGNKPHKPRRSAARRRAVERGIDALGAGRAARGAAVEALTHSANPLSRSWEWPRPGASHDGDGVDIDEELGAHAGDDVDGDGRRWVGRIPASWKAANPSSRAWLSTTAMVQCTTVARLAPPLSRMVARLRSAWLASSPTVWDRRPCRGRRRRSVRLC
jgi:hypothetical protein